MMDSSLLQLDSLCLLPISDKDIVVAVAASANACPGSCMPSDMAADP
jgi:hypothetical protein